MGMKTYLVLLACAAMLGRGVCAALDGAGTRPYGEGW